MALNSNQIKQQRDSIFGKIQSANSSPFTESDAYKYLSSQSGVLEPLSAERRAIEAQANQVLPEQTRQIIEMKRSNPNSGAGVLNMLSSLFKNQNNLRATANTIGDTYNNYQGNLRDISKNAIDMRNQELQNLNNQYSMLDNDFTRALSQEESARSRAAARAAAQASQFRPPQFNTNQAKQGAVDPTQQALNDLFNAYGGKEALTPEEINKMFGINKNNQPTPPTLLDSLGRIMNQQANLSKAQAQSRLNQLAQQFPAQSQQISNVLKFFGR
jgi:hypothetical protein